MLLIIKLLLIMDNKRLCPVCNEPVKGRADKKYCSDSCRTEFNNRGNQDSTRTVRQINSILRRNRRIIQELNPNGKTRVSAYMLAERGFNFRYFTSMYTTKKGHTYFFCYEYGYLRLEEGDYALVMREKQSVTY